MRHLVLSIDGEEEEEGVGGDLSEPSSPQQTSRPEWEDEEGEFEGSDLDGLMLMKEEGPGDEARQPLTDLAPPEPAPTSACGTGRCNLA